MSAQRASKGDAQAVLQAFGGGGFAVLRHSKAAEGAPADASDVVAIRPFDDWDGRHFCELDWHTLLIADIEGGGPGYTMQDAQDVIDQLTAAFVLDGAPLEVERTAVKRFLNPENFELSSAYYAQWGRVMAPDELVVGAHTLSVTVGDFAGSITFHIDAEGTGVCV